MPTSQPCPRRWRSCRSSPPLAGGAIADAEGVRHRVDARRRVGVAVGPDGAPFRVIATQRLDVAREGRLLLHDRRAGDAVEAAPGSAVDARAAADVDPLGGLQPGPPHPRREGDARSACRRGVAAASRHGRARRGDARRTRPASPTTCVHGRRAKPHRSRATSPAPTARSRTGTAPTGGGALVTSQPVPTTRARRRAAARRPGRSASRQVDVDARGRRTISVRGGPVRLTVAPVRLRALDPPATARRAGAARHARRARRSRSRACAAVRHVPRQPRPDAGRAGRRYIYARRTRPAP